MRAPPPRPGGLRVMFLAQCYAPEEVSAAVLITELAVDLARRGHAVTMVTGAPSYPQGRVFAGYRNRALQSEWLDGVRVVRTWSYVSPRKAFWPRLLHYGTWSATAFYGGLLAGRPDVLVSYSPPLPLGLSAWLLSRIWRVPWVLQLEDLYPDAAVAAGVLRSPAAIRLFSAMERFLYRRAHHLSVIAESFRESLARKGVPAGKMTVIPVWADPDQVRPLPRRNAFRERHGLGDDFVVLYAGNLGLTSCLEDVVEAAAILRGDPATRFVLVGEGVKRDALAAAIGERGLDNVLLLPYQPRADFAEVLAAADLGLVTLNDRSALSSLPSKTFNVMASARPVLAVAPPGSELGRLVAGLGCGTVVEPGRPAALAAAVRELRGAGELRAEMGRRGRAELETRFSREACVRRHEEMLLAACRAGPAGGRGSQGGP